MIFSNRWNCVSFGRFVFLWISHWTSRLTFHPSWKAIHSFTSFHSHFYSLTHRTLYIKFICFSFHINWCCEFAFVDPQDAWVDNSVENTAFLYLWVSLYEFIKRLSSSQRRPDCFIVAISHKRNCNSSITSFPKQAESNNSPSYRYKCRRKLWAWYGLLTYAIYQTHTQTKVVIRVKIQLLSGFFSWSALGC